MTTTATTMTPQGITRLINRSHESCLPGMEFRELIQNSLDANATRIAISPSLAGQANGRLLLAVADNGTSMPVSEIERAVQYSQPQELSLAEQARQLVQGVFNMGVGFKVACVPASQSGIVILTKHADNLTHPHISEWGGYAMAVYHYDTERDVYGLWNNPNEDGDNCTVYAPCDFDGIDFAIDAEHFLGGVDTGTVFILLGNDEFPDTYYGLNRFAEGGSSVDKITRFLNGRYAKFENRSGLPVKVSIETYEGSTIKSAVEVLVTERRWNKDTKKFWWPASVKGYGSLLDHGITGDRVKLGGGVEMSWTLINEGVTVDTLKAFPNGTVGYAFANEIIKTEVHHKNLAAWGIAFKSAYSRMHLVVHIPTDKYGINQERSGFNERTPLNIEDWRTEFESNMPKPLADLIADSIPKADPSDASKRSMAFMTAIATAFGLEGYRRNKKSKDKYDVPGSETAPVCDDESGSGGGDTGTCPGDGDPIKRPGGIGSGDGSGDGNGPQVGERHKLKDGERRSPRNTEKDLASPFSKRGSVVEASFNLEAFYVGPDNEIDTALWHAYQGASGQHSARLFLNPRYEGFTKVIDAVAKNIVGTLADSERAAIAQKVGREFYETYLTGRATHMAALAKIPRKAFDEASAEAMFAGLSNVEWSSLTDATPRVAKELGHKNIKLIMATKVGS